MLQFLAINFHPVAPLVLATIKLIATVIFLALTYKFPQLNGNGVGKILSIVGIAWFTLELIVQWDVFSQSQKEARASAKVIQELKTEADKTERLKEAVPEIKVQILPPMPAKTENKHNGRIAYIVQITNTSEVPTSFKANGNWKGFPTNSVWTFPRPEWQAISPGEKTYAWLWSVDPEQQNEVMALTATIPLIATVHYRSAFYDQNPKPELQGVVREEFRWQKKLAAFNSTVIPAVK